jgi:signal transduction histidine kinase
MHLRASRAWLPWLSVGLLAFLCACLGVLQYRWTGEIAAAERDRLQDELQSRLFACSRAFNESVSSALRSLAPSRRQVEQLGAEAAWSAQYLRWKAAHGHLLERAGIENLGGTAYLNLDLESGQLTQQARPDTRDPATFELPLTGPDRELLLVQLDVNYLRTTLLPETLNTYMAYSGRPDYDIQVLTDSDPPTLVYASYANAREIWQTADASTPLLDVRADGPSGRMGRFDRGPHRPPPYGKGGPPPFGGPSRWRLLARHKSGSLEALVARTQRRNLAVSAGVLLLILGTVAMLIRYSRQAQRLAEQQMNFVTGVSHELRTPLTVIRTAAYNLSSPKFRRDDAHIERYGKMIEAESGKLEGMVDQVLRFASASAGHAVRGLEPVSVAALLETELANMHEAIESRGVILDERIDPALPVVMADTGALRLAFRNLLDNALKYGVGETRRIGVHARAMQTAHGAAAEICVADSGPGIPPDEQGRIFDAFFRGRRAVLDQVHGTGLGLNLVKTIVEAHGGSVSVESGASSGTSFTIRIPAAEPL